MAHEDAEGPAALLLSATVARRYYVDGANKSVVVDGPDDGTAHQHRPARRRPRTRVGQVAARDALLADATRPCTLVQLTGAMSRPDVDESAVELVRDIAQGRSWVSPR